MYPLGKRFIAFGAASHGYPSWWGNCPPRALPTFIWLSTLSGPFSFLHAPKPLEVVLVVSCTGDVDIRNYAKYLLNEGTISEKRELLSCLKSRVILKDRKVSLGQN